MSAAGTLLISILFYNNIYSNNIEEVLLVRSVQIQGVRLQSGVNNLPDIINLNIYLLTANNHYFTNSNAYIVASRQHCSLIYKETFCLESEYRGGLHLSVDS